MILILFSALFSVFSVQFFTINFAITGLNRAIINTPIEMMYRDVINDGGSLYFNVEEFTNNLKSYYDSILFRYTKSYNMNLYFYDYNSKEICEENYCNAVEVNITSRLLDMYDFSRTMYYEIRG